MAHNRDDYEQVHISTATTTQVKTGAGRLHAIVIGTPLDLAGDVSVIDNITGSTVNLALLEATLPAQTLIFDCAFTTGLRIITAGADKLTIIYR